MLRSLPAPTVVVFETTDGYITVGVISNAEWEGLVRVLERPELLEDERFRTPARREVPPHLG